MAKFVLPVLAVVIAAFGGGGGCSPSIQPGYYLCSRNIEIILYLTDVQTGESIPNAVIDIGFEDYDRNPPEVAVEKVKFVTDGEGRARFFREKVMSEDIVRQSGETAIWFELPTASFSVSARGYGPVTGLTFHRKYENKGFDKESGFWRLEFNIPLSKQE